MFPERLKLTLFERRGKECNASSSAGCFPFTHKYTTFRHEALVFMAEMGDSLETSHKNRGKVMTSSLRKYFLFLCMPWRVERWREFRTARYALVVFSRNNKQQFLRKEMVTPAMKQQTCSTRHFLLLCSGQTKGVFPCIRRALVSQPCTLLRSSCYPCWVTCSAQC
jgi:hypothetical protein